MRWFTLMLVVAGLVAAAPASADQWHGHGGGYGPHPHPYAYPGGNFWGAVVGGYIASQILKPAAPAPEPAPAPAPPPPLTAWTPEWFDYCGNRYHSFDPHTGYYNGFDGQKHFCQ